MFRSHGFILYMILIIGSSCISGQADTDDNTSSTCIEEFGNCAVQRDCCSNLNCITGDWQYTTDSTCLSSRSEAIEMKSREYSHGEKVSVIMDFYEKIQEQLGSGSGLKLKSKEDVEKILRRYDNEFPKLISKLEHKYNVQFDGFASILDMTSEL